MVIRCPPPIIVCIYSYWPNSFNDFPSAFITLFELLVVNNWHVIMNGLVTVATADYGVPGQFSVIYFVSFWILAVVVVSNLIIAFILEAFFEKQDELVAASQIKMSFGEQRKKKRRCWRKMALIGGCPRSRMTRA